MPEWEFDSIGQLGDGGIVRLILLAAILFLGYLLLKRANQLSAVVSIITAAWKWLTKPKAPATTTTAGGPVAVDPFVESADAIGALRTLNRVLEGRGMSAASRDQINQAVAPFVFDFTREQKIAEQQAGRQRASARVPMTPPTDTPEVPSVG